MDTLVLEAQPRQTSIKPKQMRATGFVPAVYYGQGKTTHPIVLNYQKFKKVFDKAGENTIIDLLIDGKSSPVLVHDVQYDPVSDAISHVDFIHVNMEKEITTSVKVTFTGVAPAVKNLGGILNVYKHEIRIKCLPKDLIHSISVDLSPIVDFHTSIHVKDLKVPAAIKILDNPEDTVVTATPMKVEEEKPAPSAPLSGTEGEAAAAEGAAAPGAPAAGATPGTAPAAAPAAKEGKK